MLFAAQAAYDVCVGGASVTVEVERVERVVVGTTVVVE